MLPRRLCLHRSLDLNPRESVPSDLGPAWIGIASDGYNPADCIHLGPMRVISPIHFQSLFLFSSMNVEVVKDQSFFYIKASMLIRRLIPLALDTTSPQEIAWFRIVSQLRSASSFQTGAILQIASTSKLRLSSLSFIPSLSIFCLALTIALLVTAVVRPHLKKKHDMDLWHVGSAQCSDGWYPADSIHRPTVSVISLIHARIFRVSITLFHLLDYILSYTISIHLMCNLIPRHIASSIPPPRVERPSTRLSPLHLEQRLGPLARLDEHSRQAGVILQMISVC
ncbi:hypothetical protein D9619_008021 [Psilocybe cf. subviscida]|uniref:Uncharacterized protein n=1 Tax=Psilocybe cf. subviscida TaxID=2480587 RepID=A0A8H5AUK7_9AGAR|nr:hypothetical protein D9619_008021 [Psilocybe cf. subviscida]